MLRFLVSLFDKSVSYEVVETKEPRHTNIVYRDELSKTKKPTSKYGPKYNDVCKASSKPKKNVQRRSQGGVEEKGVIRVKVVMTKQEAARLLSKCKEGGVLGFKDAANELVQIPMNRVSVVSPVSDSNTCGAALTSIPEEF